MDELFRRIDNQTDANQALTPEDLQKCMKTDEDKMKRLKRLLYKSAHENWNFF